MKRDNRLLTVLLVLIPVIALGIISIAPSPFGMVLTWQKAHLAAAQQKYAEAADLYRKLIEFQPERTDLWNTIADLEFKGENYSSAARDYQMAEASDVITNEGQFNLGVSLQRLGQTQLAFDAWRRLANRSGLDSAEFSNLVKALRQGGDLEGALQAATAWFKVFPRDGQVAYALGLLLSYRDPAQARQILEPVSTDDLPQATKARALLSGVEAAVGTDRKEYGLVLIGQRLLQIREYDLAEQAFLHAVGINGSYAEAWALLSESEQSLGKDGWQALQKAQQLSPKSDIVRAELALYYRRQGKPGEALIVLRALSADHPQQANWLIEIGSTLAEQGDLISAMSAFEQATEIEPQNPAAWRALAAFAAENGFDAKSYSLPAAQKAVALDDKDAQSLDLMGWIWLIEGDLEKAEQFLQQALKQDANNPRTALHLAQLYLEMNRLDSAYKFLEQAANQQDDSAAALQAERLLEKYFPENP